MQGVCWVVDEEVVCVGLGMVLFVLGFGVLSWECCTWYYPVWMVHLPEDALHFVWLLS